MTCIRCYNTRMTTKTNKGATMKSRYATQSSKTIADSLVNPIVQNESDNPIGAIEKPITMKEVAELLGVPTMRYERDTMLP